ncbi:PEP-CTERM sorting domain-containing protein [Chamaesiphon polymorphus]|uniref:PEP-CTERM sorting domain-containing protein n=1 Tax=Chamaesiphon polymorphus TaxID=2107691 RepID=UPI0015E77FBF|nr:PEP-CTERM sorting domain-containing protein [Chamaesiphon polymorphus]
MTFLAVGTPAGKPPFSLLSSVSVTPTPVPEPLTIIGTIVGGTVALRLRKKLSKSTKNA